MPHKILVVDDDPLMHLAMSRSLERAGYQMLSASGGAEALDLAARELPQVILLDVQMAEMDGLAVLRHLKQAEATKAIPVIMVTVSADRVTRLDSEVSGAAVFLTKPFSTAQLLSEIARLVPKTKVRRPGSKRR